MASNRWAVSTSALATWRVGLPQPADDAGIDRIVELVAAILRAGRESEAFDIERVGHRIDAMCEAWRAAYRETAELPVLYIPPALEHIVRGSTLLAHYNAGGELVESWTYDAGGLLFELAGKAGDFTKRQTPAVQMGRPFRIEKGTGGTIDIDIKLHTDALFATVADLVPHNGLASPAPAVDNAELAARNVPRFNRFLTAARAAATEYGATWQLVDRAGKQRAYGYPAIRKHYAPFLDDAGVLDKPAKKKK
jgi:hypothetical protein